MNTEFVISSAEEPDWALERIAPQAVQHSFDIWVPLKMQRLVSYPTMDLKVTLDLVFSGHRVEILELKISAGKTYIATQDLTSLGLPKVIRAIVIGSIPDSSKWQPSKDSAEEKDLTYKYLAELYWFEHISWGAPRSAIMSYAGWSRANTNWHLRRIAKEFPLPGPHASVFPWMRPEDDQLNGASR